MITFVLILSLCLGDCYSCSPNRNSILRGINEIVRSINVKEVVMKVEDTWKHIEKEGKHQLRKLVNELHHEGPQDDERQRHEEEIQKQAEQRNKERQDQEEREQKRKEAEQRQKERQDQKVKEQKQKQAEQREKERRDQKEQKQKQAEQREKERRDQKEQKQKQAEQREKEKRDQKEREQKQKRRRDEEEQQQRIAEKELEEWLQEERKRQKKIVEEEFREWRKQERERQQKLVEEEFREWRQHERERQQKIVEEEFKEWRRQEENRLQESVKEELRTCDIPEEDQQQMTMVEQESERHKQEEKPLRMHRGLTKGQETKRKTQKRKHKIEEEQRCKRRKPENEGQTIMSGDQEKDISKRAKVSQQRDNNIAEAEELERCEENEHIWTTGIQENQAIGGSNGTENKDAKQDRTYHEDTNLNITLGVGLTRTQVMERRRINLMTLVQEDSSMTLNCWNELIETLLPKDSKIPRMKNEKNNLYVCLYTGYAMQYLDI